PLTHCRRLRCKARPQGWSVWLATALSCVAAAPCAVGYLLTLRLGLGQYPIRMIEPKTIHHLSRRLVRLSIVLFLINVVAAGAQVSSTHAQTIEDPTGRAMLGFYDSLARSYQGEWVTRILHFGDSHVAADILTGSLRRQ